MKKALILLFCIVSVITLSRCYSSKKAVAAIPEASGSAITYDVQIKFLMNEYCSPCHFPEKGGNKKPYDSYASVKTDIDEIIRRIELNPGQKGFMPFKRSKLSDSTILVFKQWRDLGVPEK
ncbi:MAG: hypothetical protein N2747_06860 [Chitinophagaceae bacterium]|nr:hypothetical protein [Chitinophagaceae bacterium]